MKYAVEPVPGPQPWRVFVRSRAGGLTTRYFDGLQDAYAFLFDLGVFASKGEYGTCASGR